MPQRVVGRKTGERSSDRTAQEIVRGNSVPIAEPVCAHNQWRRAPPLDSLASYCATSLRGAVLRQAAAIARRTLGFFAGFKRTYVAPRRPHNPFTGAKTFGSALTNCSC